MHIIVRTGKSSARDLNPVVEINCNWKISLALILSLSLGANTCYARGSRPKTNLVPTAQISVSSTTGAIPFTTTFDGSLSKDKDGTIKTYSWNFGDGTTGTGSIASHSFNAKGNFTVALTVTDDKGAVGSASTAVSVITAPAAEADGDRPKGIYSLDRVVDLPFVSGVVVRSFWGDMEPSEGVYDFSEIEDAVREATLIGQSVSIVTMLIDEPTWLMNKIPAADEYQGIQGTDIVPWNETMLSAVDKLAQAQSNFKVDGIALKDHPNVKQVGAPVGTMNSIRLLTIPQNYTAELLKEGVKRSIGSWANAYPNKHIHVGLFGVSDGTRTTSTTISTEDQLRDELLAEFNGIDKPKLNFFVEFWTGQNPDVGNDLLFDVKDQTSIMLQACGSWVEQNGYYAQCNWVEPTDTPEKGFNHAMDNFNTTYFEVYQEDLNNAAYASQFEAAAQKIEDLAATLN